MSLEALNLQSSRVSPAAEVSQAGHCMPASLRSLAHCSSRTQGLIPRGCIADLLLPSFIHVINTFASPTRPGPRACRREGKLLFKFLVFHFEKDVKGRLLLLAQHFCHLSPDPQSCRRADVQGLKLQDPCWHQSHFNEF